MTRSIFAVFVFGLMACSNAHAAFVFSNFGPGNTYETVNSRFVTTNQVRGYQFTATDSGNLTQITMPLRNIDGNPTMTVELHADNSNAVGASLSVGTVTASTTGPTLYTVSMGSATIVSGTKYWVLIDAGSVYAVQGWYFATPFATENFAESSDGGSTYSYSIATVTAFSVEATPAVANPVPEPSSLLMLGLGGLALGARSLRRIKQAIV